MDVTRMHKKSGKMTSKTSTAGTADSDVTDMTFDDTMTDRDYVLERFIDEYIGEDGTPSREERDLWKDGNSQTVLKLPPIKCSKYTVIGNPSMEKRRQRQERGLQPTWTMSGSESGNIKLPPKTIQERTQQTIKITATVRRKKGTPSGSKKTLHQPIKVKGGVPELMTDKTPCTTPSLTTPTPRIPTILARLSKKKPAEYQTTAPSRSANSLQHDMERNTLFDTKKFRKLYLKMAQPKASPMPGPLECSPRFQDLHLEVEPQLLHEKMLVLGDYLTTSRFQQYRQNRAVIPAGFPEAFRSKTFTRHYVTSSYVDDTEREAEKKLRREKTRPSCIRRELSKCHFCDVIGNKYCKSCIESKNKWFGAVIERRPVPLTQKSLPLDLQSLR